MERKLCVVFFNLLILVFKVECGYSSILEQQERDRVKELPGLSSNVGFGQYSGYVEVNKESGRTLFYWLIEAVQDPSEKPIVLWLQGGPGCSSIGLGEAEEIGPFRVNADGKSIHLNPYSWNQVANILFLDSPVGTGFSFTKNSSELLTNGDRRTADDSLVFLLNWFERFPQYKGRDFYITGESYAGHYIAILGYKWPTKEKPINFKGYMVGNALTNDFYDHLGVSEFLWSTGLISDKTYELRKIYCHHDSFLHISDDCKRISEIVNTELGNIDIYSIYTSSCTINLSHSDNLPKKIDNIGSLSDKYDPCIKEHTKTYFNLPEVQTALHVNPDSIPFKWDVCNEVSFQTWKDSASSVLNIYREAIASGLRVWMFSGDTDTVIPVTSTRYNIDALGLAPSTPWRAWYDDVQVGGWTQEYSGLNFVTIRGAGHKVPLIKPKLALVLFKSFLAGTPMPLASPRVSSS
ncbi:hypothetical protein ACHQM5_011101 [Ranunculus cassubicifolius]